MSSRNARRIGSAWGLVVTAFLFSTLLGCGGDGETLLPVESKVIFKTQPLLKGSVAYFPDAAKGNPSKNEPRGVIDAEGKFRMMTHPRDGAAPGWYKVTVTATEPSDAKNPYSMLIWN